LYQELDNAPLRSLVLLSARSMHTRSTITLLTLIWSGVGVVSAQVPTKCLEIERVLVDACNSSCSGAQEGENEMFRFVAGPAPIVLSDLSAAWATPNSFLGWVQNATTESLTAQLNGTITNCGWLLEPPGGVIPAGKKVLGITSTNVCVTGNSFADLNDTLYVIYQDEGNTFGHFKNTNNGTGITNGPNGTQSFRTFILRVNSTTCADSVTYNLAQMVNQFGTYGGSYDENDGSSLNVSWPGAPEIEYVNDGCQVPIVSLIAQITTEPEELPCGGSTGLSATATGNIGSVFWTGGTGNFTSTTAYSTTYTLGADETDGATLSFCAISICGDTICDAVQLVVEGASDLIITPDGPTSICAGTTVGLTASGGANYTWSTGEIGETINSGTAGTISVETTNSCGTVSADITIAVVDAPVASINGPAETCIGVDFDLIATGGGTYAWNTGDNADTLAANAPGTYSVVVSDVCGTDEATITVLQAETIVPTFSTALDEGCASFCVQFSASSDPNFGYEWSFGDGTTGNGANVDHCYEAGLFDITLSATPAAGDTRCPGDTTLIGLVRAWPLPHAEFQTNPQVVTLQAPTVTFTDASSDADTVRWQFGTPVAFTSTDASLAYTFAAAGCYPITLFATNEHGCADQVEHELCVEESFVLWVPNSFTPNNDGINDAFHVMTSVRSPKEFQLDLFDRWGAEIFSSNNLYSVWTADNVPDGVYVWKVRMRDTEGRIHEQIGHVVVLR